MLNSIGVSRASLAVATLLSCYPLTVFAATKPLIENKAPSLHFHYSPPSSLNPDHSGDFELTGCTPFGDADTALCFQWLGDALTTCLDWGNEMNVTACIERNTAFSLLPQSHGNTFQGNRRDWGFSVDIRIP